MEWMKQGNSFVGTRVVEIRSMRVTDEHGELKRFRISTVRHDSFRFTKIPAEGRLFKSEKGHIGIFITGKNNFPVKVGGNLAVQQSLIAALNTISKKPLRKLLKDSHVEMIEMDGVVVGIEK